ncbi:hypothetical protein BC834DRAFT_972971 [Gloeopeniophorella convolvens]|nr:hypothetical protein BC834DRAFT_972971 [Gloeopeniophorella convolvens]
MRMSHLSPLVANAPTSLPLAAAPKLPPAPAPAPAPAPRLVPCLRWANIDWAYHWGAKKYDLARGAQPVAAVCAAAVRSVDWACMFAVRPGAAPLEGWGEGRPDWATWAEMYEPDAGTVNSCQTKDALMGHVDRSRLDLHDRAARLHLGTLPAHLADAGKEELAPYARYVRTARINDNVQQVLPRGLDPALAAQG